jgi:hypothetical protein
MILTHAPHGSYTNMSLHNPNRCIHMRFSEVIPDDMRRDFYNRDSILSIFKRLRIVQGGGTAYVTGTAVQLRERVTGARKFRLANPIIRSRPLGNL